MVIVSTFFLSMLFKMVSSLNHNNNYKDYKISTACHGIKFHCSVHRLKCPPPLVIWDLNVVLGYRIGCSKSINGVMGCMNKECCQYQMSDCTIPLRTDQEFRQVEERCSGHHRCELPGLHSTNTCNYLTPNAYSKIEYRCISRETVKSEKQNETETATQTSQIQLTTSRLHILPYKTTDSNNHHKVIAGCVTALVVVAIIFIITVIIIKRKRRSRSKARESYLQANTKCANGNDVRIPPIKDCSTYSAINLPTKGPFYYDQSYLEHLAESPVMCTCLDKKILQMRITTV